MKDEKISKGKSVPTGVKIISVLYYVSIVFAVIILSPLFSWFTGSFLEFLNGGLYIILLGALGQLGAFLIIIGGIPTIGLIFLTFFIARGLWNGKNWARILVIIFVCIGILEAIFEKIFPEDIFHLVPKSIIISIFYITIQLAVGGYLLFNNKVKEYFA